MFRFLVTDVFVGLSSVFVVNRFWPWPTSGSWLMFVCVPCPGWNANYFFFFVFSLLTCRFWSYVWEGMGLGLCVSRCVQKNLWEKSECKSCESERIVLVFEWVMMSLFTGHHSSPLEPTHTHTLAYTHFFIVFAIMACVLNSSQFEKYHMMGFITKGFSWSQARDDAVMRYGSCFQTASGNRSRCLCCFQCRHDGNCVAEVVDRR